MILRSDPPQLVAARQQVEQQEEKLRGLEQLYQASQEKCDRLERRAEETEAQRERLKWRANELPKVGCYTLIGGAAVLMGGMAFQAIPVGLAGGVVAALGLGALMVGVHSSMKFADVSLKSVDATVSLHLERLSSQKLQAERQAQQESLTAAREAYESLRQPLTLIEAPVGGAVDERGDSVLVGSVVLPRAAGS
jgi:predicted RNase H-like nuclease (RuvC/YqgF family)